MALIATPKATNANTYCTEADADAYHAGHFYSSVWDALSSAKKERALRMATRILDDYFHWYGTKTTEEQALRFPRTGIQDRDGWFVDQDTIPPKLRDATAEYARWLAAEDRTTDDETGVASVTAGTVSVVFDQSDRAKTLPDVVQMMLSDFGNAVEGTAKLVRV